MFGACIFADNLMIPLGSCRALSARATLTSQPRKQGSTKRKRGGCPPTPFAISTKERNERHGLLTAHALRPDLELVSEREEHLRGRDRALVQPDELGPELVLRDPVTPALSLLRSNGIVSCTCAPVPRPVFFVRLCVATKEDETRAQARRGRRTRRTARGRTSPERGFGRRREGDLADEEPADEPLRHREARRGELLRDARGEGVARLARARREPEAVLVEAVARVLDRLELVRVLPFDVGGPRRTASLEQVIGELAWIRMHEVNSWRTLMSLFVQFPIPPSAREAGRVETRAARATGTMIRDLIAMRYG